MIPGHPVVDQPENLEDDRGWMVLNAASLNQTGFADPRLVVPMMGGCQLYIYIYPLVI